MCCVKGAKGHTFRVNKCDLNYFELGEMSCKFVGVRLFLGVSEEIQKSDSVSKL